MCTYLNKASEGRLLFREETFTRIAVQAVTSDQEAAGVGLPVGEGDRDGVCRFFEGNELVAEDDWDAVLLGVLEQGMVERDPANPPHTKTVRGLNTGRPVAPREFAQVFRQCGILDQLLDLPAFDFVEQAWKEGEHPQAVGLQTEVRVSHALATVSRWLTPGLSRGPLDDRSSRR